MFCASLVILLPHTPPPPLLPPGPCTSIGAYTATVKAIYGSDTPSQPVQSVDRFPHLFAQEMWQCTQPQGARPNGKPMRTVSLPARPDPFASHLGHSSLILTTKGRHRHGDSKSRVWAAGLGDLPIRMRWTTKVCTYNGFFASLAVIDSNLFVPRRPCDRGVYLERPMSIREISMGRNGEGRRTRHPLSNDFREIARQVLCRDEVGGEWVPPHGWSAHMGA